MSRTNFGLEKQEIIPLWPGAAPDGPGPAGHERNEGYVVCNLASPRMVVYRPEKPSGLGIIVNCGGGYANLQLGREGRPMASWLRANGITAFELMYRLPLEGWKHHDVQFQDAQRAMRVVRQRAGEFGIDPNLVGMVGFSAGGHLAATTATQPDLVRYAPVDDADKLSARPAFAGLIYAVLTMMPPYHKTHTRYALIGDTPTRAQQLTYSVPLHVDEKTPKMFLAHSSDDPMSLPEHSLMMHNALRSSKVSVALHMFQTGGHGWAMGPAGSELAVWPELLLGWLKQNGFVK